MKKLLFLVLLSFVSSIRADDLKQNIKQTNLEQVVKNLALVKINLTTEQIVKYKDLAGKIVQLRHDQFIKGEMLYNIWLAPTAQIFASTIGSWIAFGLFAGIIAKDPLGDDTSMAIGVGGLFLTRFVKNYLEYRSLKKQYEDALAIEELFALHPSSIN